MLFRVTLCIATALALPASAMDLANLPVVKAAGVHQTAIEDTDGAAERLDAAERLRTLTQEVASVACHLYNGVAVEQSKALLTQSQAEIVRILDALEFGDTSLGIIGEEFRLKTIHEISAARDIWAPMDTAVEVLLSDFSNQDAVGVIKARNEEFFEISARLLAEIAGQYANPFELTQLDALLIDIAGRQSMLTQKIAKEACEIWTGNRSPDRIDALRASVDMFHLGINALHDGLPALGIIPAPTEAIKVGLEELLLDWDIVKADLEAVISGDVTTEIEEDLYTRLNDKMYKMDKIVHLYSAFAHHNLN